MVQPHKFIIGIALVSLFMGAGFLILFGDSENEGIYDNYEDISENIKSINKSQYSSIREGGEAGMESTFNISDDQRQELIATEVQQTSGWENIILGPYRVIQRFTSYFKLVGTMTNEFGRVLHIPTIFLDFTMIALGILVMFMMVYLIMRFQPRND